MELEMDHTQKADGRRNGGAEHALRRRAVAVDTGAKAKNLRRLRRIEGQVRGVQRMVEQERYCADILVQIAAINEALRAVARELLHNHLRHCAADAIRSGSSRRAEDTYAELLGLFAKFAR
ncbi:MAG TPA: metal-sensitive transcriptional regulator [Candidatus Binataceae bacterium]|nr:metal-sensitive transcriptional regulator [Candidatus Binataceae bacterium]